eukprot:10761275-Alexandrium_andersonii.AAC.1
MPSAADIGRAILLAGASAPGVDGLPYELFHVGVDFASCLVGQAFWVARAGPGCLPAVLGPDEEFLIWIPKKGGSR